MPCIVALPVQGNQLVEAILDGPIVVVQDPRTERKRMIDPGDIGRQIMSFRSREARLVIRVLYLRLEECSGESVASFTALLSHSSGLFICACALRCSFFRTQ